MGSYKSKLAFEVCILTSEYQAQDHGPTVKVILFDDSNRSSPEFTLETNFEIDENGSVQDRFSIDHMPWCSMKHFGQLSKLKFWLVDNEVPVYWFCEKVVVRDRRKGLKGKWDYFFFPVFRWIRHGCEYVIYQNGAFFPYDDPEYPRRENELYEQKMALTYFQRNGGFPMEVKEIPNEEIFQTDTRWDLEPTKLEVITQNRLTPLYNSTDSWISFDELGNLYPTYSVTEPNSLHNWIKNDLYFGAQRLRGCNPYAIKVCTSIPENFGVSDEWLKPYLEGWTLSHILQAKRLFMVDYRIMSGIECKKNKTMCAPMALFFFTDKRQMKPLAIQLKQDIEEGNPVFIHTDNPNVWLQAKMWFNMVDACHHLILGRILPHLILDGIYAAFRRNLAQSHPLYILMAPHFEHILPVNKALKDAVFSSDGWIFRNIQLSKKGIRQLIRRGFKEWRYNTKTLLHQELESRGVYDSTGLSLYPYRDDGLLIYKCVNSYFAKYCQHYYSGGRRQLLSDGELQSWRRECCMPIEEGGLGLEGVPGTREGFTMVDDLVKFLVGLMQMLVVQSSATRIGAYDEYGYPPNYPLHLNGMPPEDPLSTDIDDAALMDMLPNKHHSLDTLLSIRLSSKLQMRPFGNYRVEYIHEPVAKEMFSEFKHRLTEVSRRIQERNKVRDENFKYSALDPSLMTNFPGV